MMRHFAVLFTAIVLATMLWGCPYSSSVPLSEAKEYVNKQVLGHWMPRSEMGKAKPEYYAIEMRDTLHYDIDHFQYNENEDDYALKEYIGWTTRIDNVLFMNVQESGQQKVMLYRLDVMGDNLMVLYEVTANIDEKFNDSAKMQEFFMKYKDLSFFYSSDEVELIKKED